MQAVGTPQGGCTPRRWVPGPPPSCRICPSPPPWSVGGAGWGAALLPWGAADAPTLGSTHTRGTPWGRMRPPHGHDTPFPSPTGVGGSPEHPGSRTAPVPWLPPGLAHPQPQFGVPRGPPPCQAPEHPQLQPLCPMGGAQPLALPPQGLDMGGTGPPGSTGPCGDDSWGFPCTPKMCLWGTGGIRGPELSPPPPLALGGGSLLGPIMQGGDTPPRVSPNDRGGTRRALGCRTRPSAHWQDGLRRWVPA